MKVQNMTSSNGNPVANQFVITRQTRNGIEESFQSYGSLIARITDKGAVKLDRRFWDYSVTTGKYRNRFLNETKADTQKKIDSGEYKLVNLN